MTKHKLMIGIALYEPERVTNVLPGIVDLIRDLTMHDNHIYLMIDGRRGWEAYKALDNGLKLAIQGVLKFPFDASGEVNVPRRIGVAGNKNRICSWFKHRQEFTHLFLFEDDTFPIADGWDDWFLNAHEKSSVDIATWQPKDFYNGITRRFHTTGEPVDMEPIATMNDGMALLSANRTAMDGIGGFHPAYKHARYGNEHSELMRRASKAGYCPWSNTTFFGCEQVVDSLDYQNWRGVTPTFPRDPAGSDTLFKKHQPTGLKVYHQVDGCPTYQDPDCIITWENLGDE